jgi:hypothetical protein
VVKDPVEEVLMDDKSDKLMTDESLGAEKCDE